MASHKSAEKRARQSEKRRQRNRPIKGRARSVVKDVRTALQGSDPTQALGALREAERQLRKAASKGVIPKRRASRSIGRLARAVSRMSPRS